MVGRLIVALLVILSAAAVMWQRQQAESADVNAQLSAGKAQESDKRVDQLEADLQEREEQIARLQARNRWLEKEMKGLAEDCTPEAEESASLRIAAFKWRGVGGDDRVGERNANANGTSDARFSLVLEGGPVGVERVRIFASTVGGVAIGQELRWDSRDPSAMFLGVGKDGGLLEERHENKLAFESNADAPTFVELLADDVGAFLPGKSFTVEITTHDGVLLTKTATVR